MQFFIRRVADITFYHQNYNLPVEVHVGVAGSYPVNIV